MLKWTNVPNYINCIGLEVELISGDVASYAPNKFSLSIGHVPCQKNTTSSARHAAGHIHICRPRFPKGLFASNKGTSTPGSKKLSLGIQRRVNSIALALASNSVGAPHANSRKSCIHSPSERFPNQFPSVRASFASNSRTR